MRLLRTSTNGLTFSTAIWNTAIASFGAFGSVSFASFSWITSSAPYTHRCAGAFQELPAALALVLFEIGLGETVLRKLP